MKVIINGYLQADLVSANVDLVDIEIIKYFQQFSTSDNMKHIEVDGQLYFWLSYQKLIDDLPIIKIQSKRAIARRFKELVDKGIFDRKVINKSMKNYTYFRLTELHQSWLLNMDNKFKKTTVKPKAEVNKKDVKKSKPHVYDETFEMFWSAYPNKINKKGSEIKFLKLSTEEHSLIMDDLDKRKNYEGWTKDDGKYVPHPLTYLNQRRWEDEYKQTKPKVEQESVLKGIMF